jgi:hypothetical protein
MFLHNFLNVLVQIANKTGLQKNLSQEALLAAGVPSVHSRKQNGKTGAEWVMQVSPEFGNVDPRP